LFASFIAVGVMIATLFSRESDRIGRLYFADLVGAGIACAVVVSLIGWIGPPATIFLAGLVLAVAGLRLAVRGRSRVLLPVGVVIAAVLAVCVVRPGVLPQQRADAFKGEFDESATRFSSWSPIFRVDVVDIGPDRRVLYHDGLVGSVIQRWDGNRASLAKFGFDTDPRALPFAVAGTSPDNVLIVGAAGGHEVLASLSFDTKHVDAVELNPVTHELVTDTFADYAGHLADDPAVNYVEGDGRSFLARSDDTYNIVWYPAPDSYAATNAATAGAYVLSESYLYTSETIKDSLEHLGAHGVLAAQFGEFDYDRKPNRTSRYVATARHALGELGIRDPARHILVATSPVEGGTASLSTILVKRDPFTAAEVDRTLGALAGMPGATLRYAPGHPIRGESVSAIATLPGNRLDRWYDSYPYDVRPITDDSPFFWHFTPFRDVIADFGKPIDQGDFEIDVGERVLLLLLGIATLFAAVFLLLPFVRIRSIWSGLPRKRRSALYFTALGLGFMFFEITLIQRLVLFLGYPTYSLTVTLAAILLFTGIGALLSSRYQARAGRAAWVLLGALAVLTVFYELGLTPMTDALLSQPLGARVLVAFVVLAPLGICLGAFMPLGLGAVAGLTEHPREYVAWGWAVNGFASVIGAVLTTILAMALGFGVVLALALVVYVVAVLALRGLLRGGPAAAPERGVEVPVPGALTGVPKEAPVGGA
jgi:hypothetical protein